MGKTNLKDIAAEAGVSISTVSRVINDPEQVQVQTREAVYQAMRTLGYKPMIKAAAPQKRKGAVALITSYSDSEFFVDFILALQEEFSRHDLYPLLIDTRGEISLSTFIGRNSQWVNLVDAAIVFYCHIDEMARDFLQQHNLPAATVHSRCSYYYSMMNNDYLGGYDAASYLWEKGHRDFGLVFWGKKCAKKHDDRKVGFCRFLEEKGSGFDEAKQQEICDMTIEGGYQATKRLLSRCKPDAVFYACDIMAIGGIEYCREEKIRIPQDVAVMGFDDIRMAEAMNLSTMRQFIEPKARAVSEHIMGRLNGAVPAEFPEEVTITPVVVERKTT